MRMSGAHFDDNTSLVNKYLYNGKEIQNQTGMLDYGFRQLDVQLGRWHVVDALAENHFDTSPYAYVKNNPINYIDVLGLDGVPYHSGRVFSEFMQLPRNSHSLGGGGYGFQSSGVSRVGGNSQTVGGIINTLYSSTHGGTWSQIGGFRFFGSSAVDGDGWNYFLGLPTSVSGLTRAYLTQNGKSNAGAKPANQNTWPPSQDEMEMVFAKEFYFIAYDWFIWSKSFAWKSKKVVVFYK